MNSEQRRAARRFQSALPLRGATHLVPLDAVGLPISIRAPLAGSDKTYGLGRPEWGVFQSALPLRGATVGTFGSTSKCCYFNPRSPCGERRALRALLRRLPIHFNPRSPCGERRRGSTRCRRRRYFNPRSPCGERPRRTCSRSCRRNFNPRSPCGERPLHFVASIYYQQSVVFSKTVTANSVDKLRKTTAKSAITRCEPHS